MTINKRKRAAIAVAIAAVLLLGGTFAWQSISQRAVNEASASINPGGRLHDDFNGTNKDVYVENFATDDIFARVRLDEYFEITMNEGTDAEMKDYIVGREEDGKRIYKTYVFGQEEETYETFEYWNWLTGGRKSYMPTFNKNKDSLAADVKGKHEDDYAGYKEYAVGTTEKGLAVYDVDTNNLEEESPTDKNIETVEETHTAKSTLSATLISMEEWLDMVEADGKYIVEKHGNYWVYDTDGWVYWSAPIKSNTATGLLLDGIEQKQVIDDSWFYAIEVVAQFITADDLGRGDGTGFYNENEGEIPSEDALKLLEKIGVDTSIKVADEEALETAFENGGNIQLDGTVTATDPKQSYNFMSDFWWIKGGTLTGGAIKGEQASTGDEKGFTGTTLYIDPEGEDAGAATVTNTKIESEADFAVYVQAYDAPVTLNDVDLIGKYGGLLAEYKRVEDATVTLNDVNITAGSKHGTHWLNSAVAAAGGAEVVINGGSYIGNYAAYVWSSGGSITINDGYFEGELRTDKKTADINSNIIIKGGTFTANPETYVAEGFQATYDEDTKLYTVTTK